MRATPVYIRELEELLVELADTLPRFPQRHYISSADFEEIRPILSVLNAEVWQRGYAFMVILCPGCTNARHPKPHHLELWPKNTISSPGTQFLWDGRSAGNGI